MRRCAGRWALGLSGVVALACEAGPAVRAGTMNATDSGGASAATDGAAGGETSGGDARPGDRGGDADAAGPDAAVIVPGRLALNEAMPTPPDSDSDSDADWFELVALGEGPVDLGAYSVVDGDVDHRPARLPAMTLQPGEFIRIFAGSEPPDGAFAVPFGLGRDDGLVLFRDGAPVDGLRWSATGVGPTRSWGRLPDGVGEPRTLTPTPGTPNLETVPDASLFGSERLVAVELRFTDEDWATFNGPAVFAAPLPARLTLRDDAPRAVTVRRDAAADAMILDLDPEHRGDGVEGHRQLVLQCNTTDPTRLRDVLALEMALDFGVQAPVAVLSRSRLQDEPEALCTLREAVDADFAAARFGAGALFRVSPPAADLRYRGRAAEDYVGLTPLAPMDADPVNVMILAAALNMGDPAAYPSVLVLEDTLRFLVLQAALVDLSGYGGAGTQLAFFDAAGRILPVPVGMPGAFGGTGCTCEPEVAAEWPVLTAVCGPLERRPLIRRLQEPTMLRERALGVLRELLDGPLAPESFDARVERWAAIARAGPVPADFEAGLEGGVPGGPPGLRAFGRRRAAVLRDQLTGVLPAAAVVAGCRW